ncbi:hypothetical protein EFK50_15930 [Nocardioides marmoriginsengisoli]|uniref:Uncharacterized protein n=1 Tax=Nocardioides marmoriginsengisoli TaxID=661483 RepID=A0A3N0CIN1_9ACTN|nr:hypothetical protein [Nocardioides marmoriginsengisoli]RNL63189.1 hypothetical protein EFK50_15930 [Nocardioides marmoriginsengisoli]
MGAAPSSQAAAAALTTSAVIASKVPEHSSVHQSDAVEVPAAASRVQLRKSSPVRSHAASHASS